MATHPSADGFLCTELMMKLSAEKFCKNNFNAPMSEKASFVSTHPGQKCPL